MGDGVSKGLGQLGGGLQKGPSYAPGALQIFLVLSAPKACPLLHPGPPCLGLEFGSPWELDDKQAFKISYFPYSR